MSEIAKKDSTGAWPINQRPPPPDRDKDSMYVNRQQPEKLADWKRGIEGVRGVR